MTKKISPELIGGEINRAKFFKRGMLGAIIAMLRKKSVIYGIEIINNKIPELHYNGEIYLHKVQINNSKLNSVTARGTSNIKVSNNNKLYLLIKNKGQ